MKAYLLFLSSILLFFAFDLRAEQPDSIAESNPLQKHTFQIETGNGFISGLLLVAENDESITGSLINEFGVSAIDFVYSRKNNKVRLLNVVSLLNKWYIKRVLRNDLEFCLHVLYDTPYRKKHNYEIARTGDSITITNSRRHLKYTFSPLTITDNDTEE